MDDDTSGLIDLNKDNLSRVIGFVDVMDAKAKFVLTLALALTSYLVTQLGPYLDAHRRWSVVTNWAPPFFVVLDLAAIACLALFLWTAIVVVDTIKPRTTRHTGKSSPLFFATIADMAHEDFKATMKRLTPNEIIDLLADQTYDNARIVCQKTAAVQRSVKLFCWGMACFFAFTIGRPILLSLVGR